MSLTKVSYSMIIGAPVNVLDYGAKGDGVTNDTAAIQAAIDAAHGTQQVFFPAGTYKVTATLNLYKGSNLIGINQSQG
jgi:polygalacturonase